MFVLNITWSNKTTQFQFITLITPPIVCTAPTSCITNNTLEIRRISVNYSRALYLLPRTTVANDKQKEGIIKILDGGCATHACERFSHVVHNRDTCMLVPLIYTPNLFPQLQRVVYMIHVDRWNKIKLFEMAQLAVRGGGLWKLQLLQTALLTKRVLNQLSLLWY